MSSNELETIFTYATLTEEQRTECRALFAMAREFATFLNQTLPECREKSLAITAVQQALLWSDAAIAIHRKKKDA